METYRYYSTERPVSIGTYPKEGMISFENYENKEMVEKQKFEQHGLMAWGYLDYSRPLTQKEMNDYSLECVPRFQIIEIKHNPKLQHKKMGYVYVDMCETIRYLMNDTVQVEITGIHTNEPAFRTLMLKVKEEPSGYCISKIREQAEQQLAKDYNKLLNCDCAYDYLRYLANEMMEAGNSYKLDCIQDLSTSKTDCIGMLLRNADNSVAYDLR